MRHLAVAALLAVPAMALALRFESFGNEPLGKEHDQPKGVLGVLNLKTRVYSVWGGLAAVPVVYYQGDVRALNEALDKFAAVKGGRLVLLPGRGRTHSFARKVIDFDWRLNVAPGGDHAVLTAYVNAERPRGAIDVKQARKWIADLDSDEFEVRRDATRALERLGGSAKKVLRETLKGGPVLEVRRRVEALLARLPGPDVDDLAIPAGAEVVTATDLLAEHLKGLKKGELSGLYGVTELAPYSDEVVPGLVALLDKGNGEYTRRWAASCLAGIGAGAKDAVGALKGGLDDPDVNVRSAFRQALDVIEKAKDDPGRAAEVRRLRAVLKDLDEWKKARRK